MSWLANIVYIFAAIAYFPILFYQMLRQGKNRRGWGEKLFGPRNDLSSDGGCKRIWVHAVSLGEINAARGIIDGLDARFPDHQVVISNHYRYRVRAGVLVVWCRSCLSLPARFQLDY